MTKLSIILLILFFSSQVFAQRNLKSDAPMNDCAGAINIFENGDFQMQFMARKSDTDLARYKSIAELNTDNLLWCAFVAPSEGKLTFNASVKEGFIQMVIFSEERSTVCEDIVNGSAEINRLHVKTDSKQVGLDPKTGNGILYTLELKKGQHIQLAFATLDDSKQSMLLRWQFVPDVAIEVESKVVDKRYDDFATTLAFRVIDLESKQPVIANFAIEGTKDISGLYVGSEFYFNLDRNSKLNVKCDAEGYFFHDSLYEVSNTEDVEVQIALIRLASGRSIQIEEIEFEPGTSEIKPSSIPNLRRLKDFLALNADVNIEIQGHVFAIGDNSMAAQRVSEARAKRVMKYLIDNGIAKERLTAVGYGNTKPIYEKPKFFYEEQANRRVEIMVK